MRWNTCEGGWERGDKRGWVGISVGERGQVWEGEQKGTSG